MRTSMTLDDAQLEQALQALVERESASRLVALGEALSVAHHDVPR